VTVRIFDGAGRLVSTLYGGASIGEREITWKGRDGDDQPLPPGLYICHIRAVEAVTGRTSTQSAPIVIGTQLK
jgi:flagellar hook assembly protein FlgD